MHQILSYYWETMLLINLYNIIGKKLHQTLSFNLIIDKFRCDTLIKINYVSLKYVLHP